MMAALLQHGVRRIGGSLLQRTLPVVTSPAVAEERRRLVPRRMLCTEKRGRWRCDKVLEEQFKRPKPHQIFWELIKSFPARKILKLVAGTIVLVIYFADAVVKILIIAAGISVIVILLSMPRALRPEEVEKKRKEAEKRREQ